MKQLIIFLFIFITGLHKKPQGCGASVASAAGPFSTKESSTCSTRTRSKSYGLILEKLTVLVLVKKFSFNIRLVDRNDQLLSLRNCKYKYVLQYCLACYCLKPVEFWICRFELVCLAKYPLTFCLPLPLPPLKACNRVFKIVGLYALMAL
jgi:hypothetical protein